MESPVRDILLIVVSQVFTIFTIWFKDYYIKQKLDKKTISPIDKSELFIKLTQTCGQIRNELSANGVYIAYFHNGDYYKNGLSIDKFTAVAEDFDEEIGETYIKKYQTINLAYISYLYHRLLTDGRYYHEVQNDSKILDSNYREDLLKRGIKNTYSFLIRDADEKPVGFVSLEYTSEFTFKREYESSIWKHQLSTLKSIKNIHK